MAGAPRLLALLAAPIALAGALPGTAAAEPNSRPETIPALDRWQGGEGEARFTPRSRIVIPAVRDRRRLDPVARTLARDLRARYRRSVRIRRGVRSRPGDIVLGLRSSDRGLGREGYRLGITDRVVVRARTSVGVLNGTRTVLQLLATGDSLPRGHARDVPLYRERGLMVDVGRKHFTVRWLRRHIEELAYLKMNHLHLHLSDDQGFRIESEAHPAIVSDPHLTKAEVRSLIAHARRYGVTIVPEIDMPGHMEAALAPYPHLQLRNVLGIPEPDKLDVTLPAARAFVRDLLEEYLPLFDGPWWHVGADEYLKLAVPIPLGGATRALYHLYPQLEAYAQRRHGPEANGHDAVDDFVNFVHDIVREHGKQMRMWHDGLDFDEPGAVEVDPSVVAEWWIELLGPSPHELIAKGHRIVNAGWFPSYYVQGPLAAIRPDMATAYETWEPHRFYGPLVCTATIQRPPASIAPGHPQNLGTKLHVWNDEPEAETEESIAAGISHRLRVIAQKGWGSAPVARTYPEFLGLMDRVGRAPGFDILETPPSHRGGRDCPPG